MRILFDRHKSDFYERLIVIISFFSHFLSLSTLLTHPHPARIIFLPSKIIIIAAPKVLMVSETKLKVMIWPRRRVSFCPNVYLHSNIILNIF